MPVSIKKGVVPSSIPTRQYFFFGGSEMTKASYENTKGRARIDTGISVSFGCHE